MRISERAYENFSARERLNLALAAMNRDDALELDKLRRTAPVSLYRARDLAFREMFTAITLITDIYFENCVYHYNKIQHLELILIAKDNPQWGESICKEKLEKIISERIKEVSKLKAVKEGLIQFCKEADLDSNIILSTANLKKFCFDIDDYFSLDITVDEEYAIQIKDELNKYWHY